jgi:hypothetical protein
VLGLLHVPWRPHVGPTAARRPTFVPTPPGSVEPGHAKPEVRRALGLGSYGRILTVLTCDELPTPEEQEAYERRREAGPRNWREGIRPWQWDDPDEGS